jgi:signal transduction histidine kinase/CheY-like chemotaxis protein
MSETAKILNVHDHVRLMLDAMPFICHLWGREGKIIDCNEANINFFKLRDKQELFDNFHSLSPECQPDGQRSDEKAAMYVAKAFEEGKCVFEWMHQATDGTLLPMEIALVRVSYEDGDLLASYSRDLREHKRMLREIEQRDAELKNALKTAQEANQTKNIFLARMSHEMRTPLNAIIGLSELLLANNEFDEQCSSDIGKISNAGATLLNLVNDLLDISKIEAGKFELVPAEYDTPSLINDALTQSILYIGQKPVQCILDIDENLPLLLYGDELRVKQILNNLLSNAFKYTRKGTVELGMRCVREGDAVRMTVQVRDTGIGIRPEDLGRLFTDYVQLDEHSTGGTGLGLAITKRMIEMMDGSITVASEYKKGSVFTAEFQQKFVSDATIGPEVMHNLKTFHYSDHKRQRRTRLARLDLSYARVLVVDDMLTNLDVAKGMMQFYSMQIDCMTSGQQAIDAIRAEKVRYNAVFMDHMMPGLNGIDATRIIREDIGTEYAQTVPIIALTANAAVGNEEMFLNNGFQAFLSKPIDVNLLDAVMRQWVRDKELEETLAADTQSLRHTRGQSQARRVIPARKNEIDRRTLKENIAGLHIRRGMQRFGGDEHSFLKVLRTFASSTRPLLEEIGKVRQDALAEYAVVVHGIKGASRGVCADMLGDKAEALEQAAKAGDFGFVRANNPVFLEVARQLVADIENLLGNIAATQVKPKKDTPDTEALARLFTGCKNNDMDEVDTAMAELEAYEYVFDDGLMAWLRDNVDQINLTQIQEKISAFAHNTGD